MKVVWILNPDNKIFIHTILYSSDMTCNLSCFNTKCKKTIPYYVERSIYKKQLLKRRCADEYHFWWNRLLTLTSIKPDLSICQTISRITLVCVGVYLCNTMSLLSLKCYTVIYICSTFPGNAMLTVGMINPSGNPEAELTVKRATAHSYTVSYMCKEPGEHSLSIKWGDEDIPGSPFSLHA